MQFIVPQFIDVEDKILGPLSVRQFIILIAGTGVLFAAYRLADFSLFLLEAFFVVVLTFLFAFVRVNGRPFHLFLLNILQTVRRPKLRVWRRVVLQEDLRLPKMAPVQQKIVQKKPPLTASRLAELALVVDTGGAYRQDDTSDLL